MGLANSTQPREPSLLVVSGPSGVGKGTVVKALLLEHPSLCLSISLTTRAPRAGEENGVHYHFVTRDQFMQRVAAGDLLEWAEYNGQLYGTSKQVVQQALQAGQLVVLEIDPQGARQIRRHFPSAFLVMLTPPSWQELERRLRTRGTEEESMIERRLAIARQELEDTTAFDVLLPNVTVADSVMTIAGWLTQNGCLPGEEEGQPPC